MSVASAPSTPVAAARSSPIHRALNEADVAELHALMAALYPNVGALLGDLAALDEDLVRDTANAKLRLNGAIIVSLLKATRATPRRTSSARVSALRWCVCRLPRRCRLSPLPPRLPRQWTRMS